MTVTRTKCRDHDGWFKIIVKPGRRPVRCTEENPCDMWSAPVTTSKRTRRDVPAVLARKSPALPHVHSPESAPEPQSPVNLSVPKAQAAKAELEALGWTAKGRGWIEQYDNPEAPPWVGMAEVTASRGSESLVITWNDGAVIRQDYNLWHNRRSLNGMPATKLKFNPDEMTDRELIRQISGMKVTWWNTLGKTEETYVVSGDKLSIEHFYTSDGEEDTGRRIVKFIDHHGKGYRHFHVEALMKVG